MRRIALPVLLATSLLHTAAARAETTQCTPITSLPVTLTTQGVYCLRQDLNTAISSGAAITVATNNVTLDCNDRKLGGLAAGIGTSAVGIRADGRQNVTIRNCTIRGFQYGINLSIGAGHLVEHNRIDQSTYVGVQVYGDAGVIRDNRINDTGGAPGIGAYGINIPSGSSTIRIVDNSIMNVTANQAGSSQAVYGLRFGGRGHEIRDNHFANLIASPGGTAYGTYGAAQAEAILVRNSVLNLAPTTGTGMDGGTATSHCKDNAVHNFSTGFAYCVDFGGNSAN